MDKNQFDDVFNDESPANYQDIGIKLNMNDQAEFQQSDFQKTEFQTNNQFQNMNNFPNTQGVGIDQQPQSNFGVFTFQYWQTFFNVSSRDIRDRLIFSLIPCSNKFNDKIDIPDVYGPFWIYSTLICSLAIAGNFAFYLALDEQKQDSDFSYNFDYVPIAAGVIYGFGFLFPAILWIIFRVLKNDIPYLKILCTYGYSYSIFIPAVLISSLPSQLIRWIVIIYAGLSSSFFLMLNLKAELDKFLMNHKKYILGFIGAVQLSFVLVVKFNFFEKFANKE